MTQDLYLVELHFFDAWNLGLSSKVQNQVGSTNCMLGA